MTDNCTHCGGTGLVYDVFKDVKYRCPHCGGVGSEAPQ